VEEFRTAALVDLELEGMNVDGYVAVFDSPWSDELTEKMGYIETVKPGAFRKALAAKNNIPLTWQHERRDMLATTGSGNLRLKEDGKGLRIAAKLPDNSLGQYVRSMIEAGDVRGMSYGIELTREDSVMRRVNGVMNRQINNVRRIIDTTLTYEPAYPGTSVELRTQAFVALPLQELVGGTEEQTGDAAAEESSLVTGAYRGRMATTIIDHLERGATSL